MDHHSKQNEKLKSSSWPARPSDGNPFASEAPSSPTTVTVLIPLQPHGLTRSSSKTGHTLAWPSPLPKFPGICVASPLISTSLFSPHLLNETPVGCPTTAHLHFAPCCSTLVSFQSTHPLLTNNRELAIFTVLCFSMSSLGPPSPLLAPMLKCVQLLCPQYGSRPWHS